MVARRYARRSYASNYMDGNKKLSVIFIGFLLIVTGAWILFGIYPFTSEMFGFPSGGNFMAYIWWFIAKVGLGVGMPVLGGWLMYQGVRA